MKKKRLVKFFVIFVLILIGCEWFARANGKYFFALSDRLLLRAKILERAPDTEVLFIGSSRFLDAIDQKIFSEVLEEKAGRPIKSLNGATTGFQGARFAYFAEVAAKNPHLTHVILEASSPSLQNGELDFPDQNPPTEEIDESEKFADRLEEKLQQWVSENIALVKYRKSLRPRVLFRLAVLFSADSIDPNVWSRGGIIANLFESAEYDVAENFYDQFAPEIIQPDAIAAPLENLNPNHIYENLERVSEIFEVSGIEVIWVAPPVSKEKIKGNYSAKFTRFYQTIAHRFGTTFYDYAGLGIDEEFLRDPTHLNAKGRALFSTILAERLAEHF